MKAAYGELIFEDADYREVCKRLALTDGYPYVRMTLFGVDYEITRVDKHVSSHKESGLPTLPGPSTDRKD